MKTTVTLPAGTEPSLKVLKAQVAKLNTYEEKLWYLAEIAAREFKCVDKCEKWAAEWLARYEP